MHSEDSLTGIWFRSTHLNPALVPMRAPAAVLAGPDFHGVYAVRHE